MNSGTFGSFINPAKLRELRKAAGMTQKELAAKTGVRGHATVGSWESGKSVPMASAQEKIAMALGCKVADLRGEGRLGLAVVERVWKGARAGRLGRKRAQCF